MSCKIEDIKKDSINELIRVFRNDVKNNGGIKSISPHPKRKNAVRLTVPVSSKKVKNQSQLPYVLKNAIERVEEWAENRFGKKFTKGWVSKPQLVDRGNQTGDTYTINFNFPLNLERAYIVKKSIEEELGNDFFKGDNALREQEERSLMLQKKSKSEKEPNKKLNTKLTQILSSYGITVEHVNNMKDRLGVDAVGAADIFNKVILISKGKEDISTLPEEAAHFFVEMLPESNPLLQNLMSIIDQSEIYKDNFDAYANDTQYQNEDGSINDSKIRKEMVGKAISEAIINKSEQGYNNRILRALNKFWNKIMSMFKKVDYNRYNEEVNKLSEKLVNEIMTGDANLSTDNLSKEIFLRKEYGPQLTPKEQRKIELLKKSVATLESRMAKLFQSGKSGKAEEIESTKQQIEKLLDKRKTELGIRMFYGQVATDVDQLLSAITGHLNGTKQLKFNSKKFNEMEDFIAYYEKPINEIITAIKYEKILEKEYGELLETLEGLATKIADISRFKEQLFKEATIEAVNKYDSTVTIQEEIFDDVNSDTNGLRFWVGSMKNADDKILRMVYSVLQNTKNNVDNFTWNLGRDLSKLHKEVEDSGFKDFSSMYERDSEGKKTGRLTSKYNLSEYNKALSETIENIKKDLNIKEYSQIDKSLLSAKDRAIYNSHWNKFKKENQDKHGNPAEKFKNPAYETIKQNEKAYEYLNTLKKIKKEADEKLPTKYRGKGHEDIMPMIRKSVLDRLKSREGKFFDNVKELGKDMSAITSDETEYGNLEALTDVNGKEIRLIPIYYTAKLENMDNLSDDITSMYIAYAKMAENFNQMTEVVDDLEMIRKAVAKRNYKGKFRAKQGVETNTYKAVDSFLDTHLYGRRKTDNAEIKLPNGKTVHVGKLVDSLNTYVRRNNLVFNAFSTLAGYATGSVYSKVEDIAGVFTDQETKIMAELEFDKNIANVISNIGSKTQNNKMHQFLEINQVTRDNEEIFNNYNLSRAGRIISNDFMYGSYGIADYRVKAKIALSMAYSIREVEGEYISKSEFKRIYKNLSKAEQKAKWKEAKSKTLYDAYEMEDGKLKIKDSEKSKISEDTLNVLKNKIQHVGDIIDGKLSTLDRGNIQRNTFGRAVMVHRGWLPTGIDARFKKGGYSYSTDEYEEGYWRTTSKLFGNMFVASKRAEASLLNYKNLDDAEKGNIKRFTGDMAFMLAISVIAAALANAADDDKDDYGINFASYMTNRVLLEVKAFWSPGEIFELLNSPAAGVNHLQDLTSLMTLFDGEIIERGMYKGKSKREKLLIKRSFLRHFYEVQFPREKNKWIEQKVKDTFPFNLIREKND